MARYSAEELTDLFDRFWQQYPKRHRASANPKHPARVKFERMLSKGIEPRKIIDAAQLFAEQMRREEKDGTEFVPQAATWLNQRRFEDVWKDSQERASVPEKPATIAGYTEAQLKRELDKAARGWSHNRTAVEIARTAGVVEAPKLKGMTLRLTESAWRQLKEIALDEGCSVHHLLIEGVNEVFRKRGKAQLAEDTPAGSTVRKHGLEVEA